MLRIDDVTGKTFGVTRMRDGYEIAEVDGFRTEVAEAITLRDTIISELQEELSSARTRPVDDDVDSDEAESVRRESSVSAVRLLEIAAANADQLVADARRESDSLVNAATAEADELLAASRVDAERVTAELAAREGQQTADLDRQRIDALAELAEERSALEARVERLRRQEREHRDLLRGHFAEQLAQLDDNAPAALRAVAD